MCDAQYIVQLNPCLVYSHVYTCNNLGRLFLGCYLLCQLSAQTYNSVGFCCNYSIKNSNYKLGNKTYSYLQAHGRNQTAYRKYRTYYYLAEIEICGCATFLIRLLVLAKHSSQGRSSTVSWLMLPPCRYVATSLYFFTRLLLIDPCKHVLEYE